MADCAPDNVPVLDCVPPVTHAEMMMKLMRGSAGKSCMLDPAPMALLKHSAVLGCLLPHMTSVINSSLELATVPDCLKEAVITTILKKQGLDTNMLKNYRPVPNGPILGKVMERVVAACLTSHLTGHGLYDPLQSACWRGHSTETALLRIQDIRRALARGEGTLLLLLDLSAAFDTIGHTAIAPGAGGGDPRGSAAMADIVSRIEDRVLSSMEFGLVAYCAAQNKGATRMRPWQSVVLSVHAATA